LLFLISHFINQILNAILHGQRLSSYLSNLPFLFKSANVKLIVKIGLTTGSVHGEFAHEIPVLTSADNKVVLAMAELVFIGL
jgi:hypothetical protein